VEKIAKGKKRNKKIFKNNFKKFLKYFFLLLLDFLLFLIKKQICASNKSQKI
jgi:hypothetical protein